MLLSALSFLVVVQSSSEIPEGLMNNPVYHYTEMCDEAYELSQTDKHLHCDLWSTETGTYWCLWPGSKPKN